MRRRALAAWTLALVSVLSFGQESVRLVPRRILLSVAAAEGSSFTASDTLMITRSLHQRLREADRDVLFVEPGEEPPVAAQDELAALAGRLGADGWLLVSLEGDWTSARLRVRAFDLLARTSVADLAAARTSWGSPGGLSQETWADVAGAIAGRFPMLESSAPASDGPRLARLIIKAMPGSVVTGLGAPPLKIGPNGSAFRLMPPLKEYVVRTELAGYLPVTTRIYLFADREITVGQRKDSAWGLEASLADSRAPGADFSIYTSSPFFIRFGFTTYAVGLALDSAAVLFEMPLTNLAFQVGTYLSPADRFFRFYLALSGFARLVHAPETRPMLDPLAPVGIRMVIGTESPISDHAKLYLELTPTIYQTSVPDALRATLGDDKAPGWAFGPAQALSIFSFRVGYRWRP